MPSTVPLETFILTLLVPRSIPDAAVTPLLKKIRSRPFLNRLQQALVPVLQELSYPVTVAINIGPTP